MDSRPQGLTAHRWFWLVVFALVSLGIVAGGLAYYRYEQDHVRREKYQELATIADLKVRQILEWRRERRDDGNRMTRSTFLSQAIMDWLRDPGTPGLRAALRERLKSEQEGETLGNILLAGPEGRILLSVRPDPAPLSPVEKQTLEAAVAGRQAVLGDLFRCAKDHLTLLDLAAPVLDPQGRPVAVVVLRINVDKVLYPLVQSWPTPSRTAETLLVEAQGKDVLYLNDLRFREKTALSLREPLTQTELPAVQAVLGKQGIFDGKDYRGVEVLAEMRPVPQTPWFMVAKVDRVEIMAEARYRAQVTFLFAGLFILLTAAVTAFGYRQRQSALFQDLYRTERERRQTQEEFRTTLYSIGDAVITTDTEGLVKQVNSVAERLTGWPEADARGTTIEEVFRILNEETRTSVENPVHRVLREGQVVGLGNHTLLIARDGAERPIADSGAPIRDESGAVIGVVLVFRDQAQERAAQKAQRESEALYRSLFENMLNGLAYCKMLFDHDQPPDFIYLEVNRSFEVLTGLKDVVGKKISEVIPGLRESDPELLEIYGRVALTGKPERFEAYVEALKMWFSVSVYSPAREYFVAVFDVITERKRGEEALRESEARFRMLFDYAPDAYYLMDLQGNFLDVNRSTEELTGYGREELIGRNYQTLPLVDERQHAMVAALFQQAVNGEMLGPVELNLNRKDGGKVIIEGKGLPLHRKGESLMLGIGRDITGRKQAEAALAGHLQFLQLLLDTIPNPIFFKDAQGAYLGCNKAFEDFLGVTRQEIVGKSVYDLSPRESADEYHRMDLAVFQATGTQVYGSQVQAADGAQRHVVFHKATFPDSTGGVGGLVGIITDITDLKQAEAESRESEQRFRLMAETIQDVFWIATPVIGNVVYVSPAYEQVWGRPCQELYQFPQSFMEAIHPEDRERVKSEINAATEQGIAWSHEYRIIKPDGAELWIHDRGFPVRDDQGRVILFTGVATDVTEHQTLAAQLLQAQKMEAVGRLAGGVAHDFNNLLMAITGYSELMRSSVLRDDPLYSHLENILKASDRAAALTQQLLTFSRQKITQPQVIDLNRVVLDLEPMLRRLIGEDLDLEVVTDRKPGAVKADPGQMGQIIMNLVVNARDAMPQGGRLTLKTAAVNFTVGCHSRFGLTPPGAYVRLEVADTGVGMDEATQAHVFEPFFTTKEPGKGTGLGLSTVYGIVKQSGGYLDLASEPGTGSTFTIYLPRLEATVELPKAKIPITASCQGEETVLLVEDEDMLRGLLAKFLRLCSYTVLEARHGGEALLTCEQHPGPIHLMVTDVVMPEMSGRELADRLTPLRPEMKVLYMSGYTEDALVQHGVADLSLAFLQKPFKPIELARRVHAVLHLR